MDTRYKDRGYSTELNEYEYGAFVTVWRGGHQVAKVSIAILEGGPTAPVTLTISRRGIRELPIKVEE